MAITGTIFNIQRYAIHDGPGIRTTVFFKGCPLDCRWCHNPEAVCPSPEQFPVRSGSIKDDNVCSPRETTVGCVTDVDTVMKEVIKDEIFYDQSGGGVTFSGGEPMMQLDFLLELLTASKNSGLHTVVDTSGYADIEDFEQVYDLVDLFLYDLKLMDDQQHLRYTGVSNQRILSNLTVLVARDSKVTVRIPLIPEITDTENNLEAVVGFLKPLKYIRRLSLLPYNKLGEDKCERYQLNRERYHWQRQTPAQLEQLQHWFESHGFSTHIGG